MNRRAYSHLFQVLTLLLIFLLAQACSDPNPPLPEPDHLSANDALDYNEWVLLLEEQRGNFRTFVSDDWDNWTYDIGGSTGRIRTFTSEDWDNWTIDGTYRLRTFTSEDWDHWQLTGNGVSVTIRTFTSEDWDHWEISGNASGSLRADTWRRWTIESSNWSSLLPQIQAAILFIPIFESSIRQRDLHL